MLVALALYLQSQQSLRICFLQATMDVTHGRQATPQGYTVALRVRLALATPTTILCGMCKLVNGVMRT